VSQNVETLLIEEYGLQASPWYGVYIVVSIDRQKEASLLPFMRIVSHNIMNVCEWLSSVIQPRVQTTSEDNFNACFNDRNIKWE
jgi:hypothetical protein